MRRILNYSMFSRYQRIIKGSLESIDKITFDESNHMMREKIESARKLSGVYFL